MEWELDAPTATYILGFEEWMGVLGREKKWRLHVRWLLCPIASLGIGFPE